MVGSRDVNSVASSFGSNFWLLYRPAEQIVDIESDFVGVNYVESGKSGNL